MTTLKYLQLSIDYIEDHLEEDLTLETLAKVSGFSKHHFSHLFTAYTGMPANAFITKLRLGRILYAYQQRPEGQTLTDLWLQYGFETHAGFYKAFKREFGCSPRHYNKLYQFDKPTRYDLAKEAAFMLTTTQLNALLKNWPIDQTLPLQNAQNVGGAVVSQTVWLLGDAYTLKTTKNMPGIRTHIAISKALETVGYAAPVPIPTVTGEDLLIDGDRAYCLMKQVPGQFLTPSERYSDSRRTTAEQYGIAIGELHQVLQKIDKGLEVNEQLLFDTVMNWAMPETQKILEQYGCPLPQAFYDAYKEGFEPLVTLLPRQLIHRDPNPSNILFEAGEVSGFIDFDISVRNVRLFDPCYCATGILSEAFELEGQYTLWPEILEGILEGYDSVIGLTDAERAAVPYVIYSIQMIFIAWLAKNESYKGAAITNRHMLNWLWSHREAWTK